MYNTKATANSLLCELHLKTAKWIINKQPEFEIEKDYTVKFKAF